MGKFREVVSRVWAIPYVKHPVLGVLLVVLLLFVVFVGLSLFTRHGREYSSPDFCGMQIQEARLLAHQEDINLVVTDSSWVLNHRPGEVLEQTPAAGSKVKRGRRIFLIIKSLFPPKVEAPDLRNQPIRQAIMFLEKKKLQVGTLTFPTFGDTDDNVCGQLWNGVVLQPGTLIPEGSLVDLEVESMQENKQTMVPELRNHTLQKVRSLLAQNLLNIGKIEFDHRVKTLEDSLSAVVYRSYPRSGGSLTLPVGTKVDVWLTTNANRAQLEVTGAASATAPIQQNETRREQ